MTWMRPTDLCATYNDLSDRYNMNRFTLLTSLRLTFPYIPQRNCIHLFENSCLDYFGPRKGFPTALFVELLRTRLLFGLVMICSCLHTCDPVDRHWPNRAEISAEVHFVELRPCWLRPSDLMEECFGSLLKLEKHITSTPKSSSSSSSGSSERETLLWKKNWVHSYHKTTWSMCLCQNRLFDTQTWLILYVLSVWPWLAHRADRLGL